MGIGYSSIRQGGRQNRKQNEIQDGWIWHALALCGKNRACIWCFRKGFFCPFLASKRDEFQIVNDIVDENDKMEWGSSWNAFKDNESCESDLFIISIKIFQNRTCLIFNRYQICDC